MTYKEIETAVENTATQFQNFYLDYLNDFLTVGGYASYYGISEKTANQRINIGRKVHNQRTQ
tara:strand:+ start:1364 stop:1549 length:186 start_codon:yes stop_codon:yes gene_type:complete